jgi:hypothetical protein
MPWLGGDPARPARVQVLVIGVVFVGFRVCATKVAEEGHPVVVLRRHLDRIGARARDAHEAGADDRRGRHVGIGLVAHFPEIEGGPGIAGLQRAQHIDVDVDRADQLGRGGDIGHAARAVADIEDVEVDRQAGRQVDIGRYGHD